MLHPIAMPPSRRPHTVRRRSGAIGVLFLVACSGGGGGGDQIVAPPLLAGYATNPAIYVAGEAIAPNQPDVTGVADQWSVAPPLPAGLTLDPVDGIVTGVPAAPSPLVVYTVTAENARGASTTDLVFEVFTADTTVLVSRSDAGVAGSVGSTQPAISGDGTQVAFTSVASDLVAGDGNGSSDVFVHSLVDGTTERVSVAPGGGDANAACAEPSIDASGRFVAFRSAAGNLVAGDTNGLDDVFLHDRQTGTTLLMSRSTLGAAANATCLRPSLSADGRLVVFDSAASTLVPGDTNAAADVFVGDRITGTMFRLNFGPSGVQGNGQSILAVISADGSTVAYASLASNFATGDANGSFDVFVRTNPTFGGAPPSQLVSVGLDGNPANGSSSSPQLSADGRFVAFSSTADNLVAGDTNGASDVFVHDRTTGVTQRISVASDGTEGNAGSNGPSVSADGRFVAFQSTASNLVADDTNGVQDLFRHDRTTGETIRLSVAADGTQGASQSRTPRLSGDGRTLAFDSFAALVPAPAAPQIYARVLSRSVTPVPLSTLASLAQLQLVAAPGAQTVFAEHELVFTDAVVAGNRQQRAWRHGTAAAASGGRWDAARRTRRGRARSGAWCGPCGSPHRIAGATARGRVTCNCASPASSQLRHRLSAGSEARARARTSRSSSWRGAKVSARADSSAASAGASKASAAARSPRSARRMAARRRACASGTTTHRSCGSCCTRGSRSAITASSNSAARSR